MVMKEIYSCHLGVKGDFVINICIYICTHKTLKRFKKFYVYIDIHSEINDNM